MASQDSPYGVVYTPRNVQTPSFGIPDLQRLAATKSVRYVRIQWVDFTNTVRFRILSATYFLKLCTSARPGVCLTLATLGLVGINLTPGFSGTGEYLYVPDLNSLRICTYAPGHAVVMGFFEEKLPSPSANLTIDLCPRTILNNIVRRAQSSGVSFLAGFESEFILLKSTSPELIPVNSADWSVADAYKTGAIETIVMDEICDALQDAGIELHMSHAEAAPGQYEIVTGPLPPLEAADAVVFTRQTIYNIANKHGLRATFAPRLWKDNCGSAAHIHLSVHSSSPAPLPEGSSPIAPTLSQTERSFLQSLITHLPAICALTLPTAASYGRMHDGIWSGGTYACWGTDNREAPLRLCGAPGAHHFELKSSDATANPYLALAGVLGAGTVGIETRATLSVGDCAKAVAEMSEAERREVGLENPGRLPRTIRDARALLLADKELTSVLGENFAQKYVAVNETLETFLHADTPEAAVSRLVQYY